MSIIKQRIRTKFSRSGISSAPAKKVNFSVKLRTPKAKRLFSLCRWLHIYISSALFSLLLFFCVTGITLNHPDWASSRSTDSKSITLPSTLSQTINSEEYPLKKIQAFVEEQTGLAEPRSIDLALDIGEITYDYPLPSGYVFVTVLLEEQLIEIEYSQGGWLALFNDLHKGRHSGSVWSWLIDLSAALMLLFTLTGIIILLQNAKHRRQALYILLIGSMTPVLLYLFAVPRLLL